MIATYDFYNNTFFGDRILQKEWDRYEAQAEYYIDYFLRGRTKNASTLKKSQTALKNAICVVADELFRIDIKIQKMEKTGASGAIQSISSGKESVSYTLSNFDKAVTGTEDEKMRYLYEKCKIHLMNVTDSDGRKLLYWGC